VAMSINSFIVPLIICFGLLFAVFGGAIDSLDEVYDTSGAMVTAYFNFNSNNQPIGGTGISEEAYNTLSTSKKSKYVSAIVPKTYSYNHLDSLESRIKSQAPEIEGVNVASTAFDWFAGLWSKLKSPFVFMTQSYRTLITVSDQATDKLELMPAFKQAISTIIILLVVFGLLAARYFLGRR